MLRAPITFPSPSHLPRSAMARSPSEEPKPTITDNQTDELKRLDTILKISTELKSRELREKFRQMVIDGHRAKDRAKAQVRTFNLDRPMVWVAEFVQFARLLEEKKVSDEAVDEAERELQGLRNEVSRSARILGD
jgi:hypothetical protein